ncbi:hypothetical protein, partial [Elstera litoralis]|uniref:hypothetical protein n=1 Tax=Elstera litoralis TaxID=552518 RepID=UPI0018DD6076
QARCRRCAYGSFSALVNLADETQETPSKAIAYADDALTLTSALAAGVQERWKAEAALKKTGGLFKLGKNDDALSLSRSLFETNYNSTNIIQRRIAARAALNILVYQRDTFPKKLAEIEAINQEIQTKFAKETDRSIQIFKLRSLLIFGQTHESTPKYIEAFQEIERRLAQDPTTMTDTDSFAVLRGLATMHALTKNQNKVIEYLNKIDETLLKSQNNLTNEVNVSEIYGSQVYVLQILGDNHFDRATEIINKIDRDFSKSNDPSVIENIIWANTNYLSIFLKKTPNTLETALPIVNSMIHRYGNRLDPKFSGELAVTYVNRIVIYSNLKPPRNNEILEDSDLVVSRHQDSQNPAIRAQVAKALTLRSGALERSNQPGAIQTLE